MTDYPDYVCKTLARSWGGQGKGLTRKARMRRISRKIRALRIKVF